MDFDLKRAGWFDAAAQFYDAVGHVSNFPNAYIFGMFLALSGHVIGRSMWIQYAIPLYPNHYICLVGDSGIHKKSTAQRVGLRTWGDLYKEYQPLTAVTTSQGLLQAMENQGGHSIIVLNELATMLSQRRQDFAANLMAQLTELYDSPESAGTYTRHDPIAVDEPFLTFIAASTVEWLQANVGNNDLMGGFGNRMTWILGDPREIRPWPLAPAVENLNWERLAQASGQLFLDDGARKTWEGYYTDFQSRQMATTPFVRVMSERIPEKILKASIIIAAWGKSDLIDDWIFTKAMDWGDYLSDCITKLVPSFQDAEQQVLVAIQAGAITRPKLFGQLSHQYTADQLKQAVQNLKWLGLLEEQDNHFKGTNHV